MLKKDIATTIARALYPAHYRADSPAVQGEVKVLMGRKKDDLYNNHYDAAVEILTARGQEV